MAYRPQLSPDPVVVNGDMSGAITSLPTIIQKLSMISYEVDWTGTSPTGFVAVQVSNSYSLNANGTVKNPGSWINIPLIYNGTEVTEIPLTGNSGIGFIDIDAIGAYAMRLIYSSVSGVGVMQAIISAKVS